MIEAFERGVLETLRHTDHVRLACAYLDRHDEAGALRRLLDGLARFAAARGQPGKFHVTMTRAWLEIIADARRRHPGLTDADALLDACPELRDPGLLERYYSPERLSSAAARVAWVQPDRAPFGRAL